MNIDYGVTGKERKALAYAAGEILNCKPKYLGTPNFGFAIGCVTVDKNGTVIFEDAADNDEVKSVLQKLSEKGFTAINVATEPTETATKEDDEVTAITTQGEETEPQGGTVGLTVEMPKDYFTETALANLEKLVTSKADLIKKAIGVDSLKIEITEDKVSFPWFHENGADEVKAYTHFVTALCEMARTQKRINTKEVVVENEKYAFRCFLLRLGFIGDEYKDVRKILLKNLSGSSAFKGGAK